MIFLFWGISICFHGYCFLHFGSSWRELRVATLVWKVLAVRLRFHDCVFPWRFPLFTTTNCDSFSRRSPIHVAQNFCGCLNSRDRLNENILGLYVLYPHRCLSPSNSTLYPSLPTRRHRDGGRPPVFYDVSIPLFLLRHLAYGVMSHYIYMVLFCILNELKHFGICNVDLPARVRSQFPALSRLCLSYLQD
jgi:hypothetical protein